MLRSLSSSLLSSSTQQQQQQRLVVIQCRRFFGTTANDHRLASATSCFETVHQVGRCYRGGTNTTTTTTNRGGASSSTAAAIAWERLVHEDEYVRDTLAYCLTFANDPSDFDRNMIQLDQLMAGQLSYCRRHNNNNHNHNQRGGDWYPHHQVHQKEKVEETIQQQHQQPLLPQHEHIDTLPLPQQWDEAIRYQTSRAIVITGPIRPFRIVHVNTAWEKLCGYSKKEAYGQSLGSLLHGPETDVATITSMLFPLLQNNMNNANESGAVVTNYTKTGRRFRNRVRIGPLIISGTDDDMDNIFDKKNIGSFSRPTTTTKKKNAPTHQQHIQQQQQPSYFVGVLQEIHDGL